MKTYIVIGCFMSIVGISLLGYFRHQKENYYDLIIVSGATPLAVGEKVPSKVSLTIDGYVKKDYRFSGSALNGFASTRIRTREFDINGNFQGAYAYLGIPVFHILEGIGPEKPADADFKQPLDLLVTFSSNSGKKVHFSYSELIMTDDRYPVTLAYSRKEISPTTPAVRETYSRNLFQENLAGLRLICPREPDTARYLDDVVKITFSVLPVSDHLLPRRKKEKCIGTSIGCIDGEQIREAVLDNIALFQIERWTAIGHGHGYEGVASLNGTGLRSFLSANFPKTRPSDFFLFVACDGYRALFSGREIFMTDDGEAMMIARIINGTPPAEGFKLVPAADYFADRAMWGLSYVVRLNAPDS